MKDDNGFQLISDYMHQELVRRHGPQYVFLVMKKEKDCSKQELNLIKDLGLN